MKYLKMFEYFFDEDLLDDVVIRVEDDIATIYYQSRKAKEYNIATKYEKSGGEIHSNNEEYTTIPVEDVDNFLKWCNKQGLSCDANY
jgi:hypothetical protein